MEIYFILCILFTIRILFPIDFVNKKSKDPNEKSVESLPLSIEKPTILNFQN